MDKFNLRVLIKEPRGFNRLLQVVFSALAWSTTANFKTTTTLKIDCPSEKLDDKSDQISHTVTIPVTYPFDLSNTGVAVLPNCTNDSNLVEEKFPIDFSSTSMLYVLICAISLFYAIGTLVYYCLYTAKYESDPLAPMVDLCLTLFMTILWIIITCIWALNVSDIKHYTHPRYFINQLSICTDDINAANCQTENPGKWSSLTVSIVCGFTCVVLWLSSTWYIFKETTLHKNKQPVYSQPQQQQQSSSQAQSQGGFEYQQPQEIGSTSQQSSSSYQYRQ